MRNPRNFIKYSDSARVYDQSCTYDPPSRARLLLIHSVRVLLSYLPPIFPAVRTILRVGKLSAILFTVIILIVIAYLVCVLLGGLVASHFGIVAGVLTTVACLCVLAATLRELM